MFKRPFSFEGRIRRSEYGISIIISVIANVFFSALAQTEEGAAIYLFLLIPLLWFNWAQGAKRCHDLGNSGWWQLIPFYALWLLFQDGEAGPNRYGENPKGIQSVSYSSGGGSNSNGSQATPAPSTGSKGSYQGGYDGGHNNHTANNSNAIHTPPSIPRNSGGGYKDGNLYD